MSKRQGAKWEWKVAAASTSSARGTYDPWSLQDMLNHLELDGWEIYAIVPASDGRACVVARKAA